jgi:hypothetical protein
LFAAAVVLAGVNQAMAGEGHSMIPQAPSAEFDSIKKLVGKWEGTASDMGKEPKPAQAEYRLTSGGAAVVELLFAGTPEEMESIYFNKNGKLSMTHYCMLGNRPNLELKSSDASGIFLDLAPTSDIAVATEPHMHSLKISMPDDNTLRQEWTYYQNGQAAGTTVIDFKRVTS